MVYFHLFTSQFSCTIPLRMLTVDSVVWLKTLLILIRWLLQKPSDLDLQILDLETSPEFVILFMLNSTEHEISTTHENLKY